MKYSEVQRFRSRSTDAIYTVKRDEYGRLSCSCPGWVFKRGGEGRLCRHIMEVELAQKCMDKVKV